MLKKLREHIYHIGLFACIPSVNVEEVARAADALVAGGIQGIILSWNKHAFTAVEQLHTRYPELLIGVQGPYEKGSQLFASGASFTVDTGEVPLKIQVPFLLRQGNDLIDGKEILARCSNKLVFVADIKQHKWDEISYRAACAVRDMLGFELKHVGINHPDAVSSEQTANQFEQFFGLPKVDKGGAFFAGPYVECMKKMFYGTHGHIAIATNHVQRATWYLQKRGVQFNWKSADYNADGTLRVVYLQDEIGGFAVHLIQK